MRAIAFSIMGLVSIGCGDSDDGKNPDSPTPGPDDTGAPDDTGEPPVELSACEVLGLPSVDFNPDGDSLPLRHRVAPDFSLPLVDGSEWTFSEQFSGCESYIFLPHCRPHRKIATKRPLLFRCGWGTG